jgi:hypothetical protein
MGKDQRRGIASGTPLVRCEKGAFDRKEAGFGSGAGGSHAREEPVSRAQVNRTLL